MSDDQEIGPRSRWLPPEAPGAAPPPRWDAPPPPAPPLRAQQPPAGAQPVFLQAQGSSNSAAVASLVLGISGLVLFVLTGFGLVFILNLPCSVLAWIFGVQGKRREDRGEGAGQRGLAQAGHVLGVIGTVLGLLAIIGWALFFVLADDALRDLNLDGLDTGGRTFDTLRLVAGALRETLG